MIKSKLQLILKPNELERIAIKEQAGKKSRITVDVHGMKCHEASRLINNIILIIHKTFKLTIIHGYKHGSAIKEMLAHNFDNCYIRKRYQDAQNQGVTHFLIVV